MIETVNTYNAFWLIICFAILVIVIFGIIAFVIVKLKSCDNGLFGNIFNRHSSEHEDTTDKMTTMHKEVITLTYGKAQEQEFHAIEQHLKLIDKEIELLNKKYDFIIENEH